MLTLENLGIRRGGRVVFQQLGITLGEGAALIVRGANGSGKTTLLKIIAGLITPDEGVVLWEGDSIKEDYAKYVSNVNYIGHRNGIKAELTVLENLRFYAALTRTQAALPAAMVYFDLEAYRNTVCCKLSAGLQRRVALARLMLSRARIWLLDEPFVHLDEYTTMQLLNLITVRCDQGGVVIMSSHAALSLLFAHEIHMETYH